MAKVIEFYIPTRFRKPLKWAPQLQSGKLIEFCSQMHECGRIRQGYGKKRDE